MNWLDFSQAHRQVQQEEARLRAELAAVHPATLAAAKPQVGADLRQRLKLLQRLRAALDEAVYIREAAPAPDWDILRKLAELVARVAKATGADGLADLLRQVEDLLKKLEQAAPALPQPAAQAPASALVTHVTDGDSFVVSGGWRVRCIGMDAPELRGENGRPEAFALEARGALRAMIEGREVRLVSDRDDTDRYNRLLRYVYCGDTFINAEMLRLGYAVVLTIRPNDRHAAEFEKIEARARLARVGVWK